MTSQPAVQDELSIVRWADAAIGTDATSLHVPHGERPVAMHGADATGVGLVGNGTIGADVIRLPAGKGFPPHTHPGHHVLVVLAGRGTITYNGRVHPTEAGEIYIVEGAVSHAVGAITDHVILAIGAPHMPVDSEGRMDVVVYEEVLSPIGNLHCLICDGKSRLPSYLHDVGCAHCPCHACAGAEGTRSGTPPKER
ncbi:cupin domain-containing protein [Streptomyces sp. XD-27]|uniref:cupin domain-containing protein n=1 Tax=Streptomyces sp. XD-27 TaxID=3062779 RepID=UPI0026F4463A|nr:cupin domain-containing protein [Streptomyces sp. XD-27]WKX73501.1 cupin domain-containing protein [Streptomyces sp. XD-27]